MPPEKPTDQPRRGRLWQAGFEVAGIVVVVAVAAMAGAFAHAFRQTMYWAMHALSGVRSAPGSIRANTWWHAGVIVSGAVTLGLTIGLLARRWRGERLGISALSERTRGTGPGPSLRATLLQALGTWVGSVGAASFGRESAILETGGAIGHVAGRRLKDWSPAIAAAGVAAAFTAAYHAPIGAVIYVEMHLGVRGRWRAALYTAAGAATAHVMAVELLDGRRIFPGARGSLAGMAALAAIGLVPAVVGSRLFLVLRQQIDERSFRQSPYRWWITAALIAVATAAVVAVPLAAGNGMEALRESAVRTTITVALAMGLVKMLATAATLGSGLPGGVFSPSLAVSAGWALAAYAGLSELGLHLPGSRWDGMLAAMAVGVAVSLRAPWLGAVVVAEMSGDYRIMPICAVCALAAHWLNTHADRRANPTVTVVHDDDG